MQSMKIASEQPKPINLALMGKRTGVTQSDSPYKQQLVVSHGPTDNNSAIM